LRHEPVGQASIEPPGAEMEAMGMSEAPRKALGSAAEALSLGL
jgi:hypothetical protein